jgi:hypothetical protein
MMAKSVLVACVISVLLLGCAGSAKRINNLAVGMTKAEVIEVMGEPDYTGGKKGVEILSYKLSSGGFYCDTYFVLIKEGVVDRYGRQGEFGIYY